jgi:hypothetical protein
VILGQDPYYRPGQASGLAFSVRAGVDRPRSLVNIVKELETDLGHPVPADATLEPWARNGVLLLNTALTVREGLPNSHRRQWKAFTAAIVAMLGERPTRSRSCSGVIAPSRSDPPRHRLGVSFLRNPPSSLSESDGRFLQFVNGSSDSDHRRRGPACRQRGQFVDEFVTSYFPSTAKESG